MGNDTGLAAVSSGLARALDAAAGNEADETAAMKLALAELLKLRGAPEGADPAEYQAAEFFAEGWSDENGSIPPVFEQMKDCDDDNQQRLWALLADVAGY